MNPSPLLKRILECILVISIIYLIVHTCTHEKGGSGSWNSDSTFYWKNKYNQQVASQKGTAEQFSAQTAELKRTLDSVARIYDTKARHIQELVIAATRVRARLIPVPGSDTVIYKESIITAQGDTCPPQIKRMLQTFSSRWYTAKVGLGDTSFLDLDGRDTVIALWKTVKEGNIFNRKKFLQLDVSFADTSRQITGLTAFRREIKPKELAVFAEANVLYLNKFQVLGGLGIQRQKGRLSAGLSGGKALSGSWYGKGSLQFNIIRL